MSTDKRKKMMEKVAHLLAKAEASDYGDERDAFRAKADELMVKYAIEEGELALRQGRSLKDDVVVNLVVVGDDDAWITPFLDTLLRRVADSARCKHIGHPPYRSPYEKDTNRTYTRTMSIVGLEQDTEYVEMVFTSLRLQIANTLEPQYDHGKSLEDNVYQMRNAGLKNNRIEKLCGLSGGSAVRKHYEAACAARGEEPRKNVNPTMAKRNFVEGFVNEVALRLRKQKQAQEQEQKSSGTGTALVPVTNAVDEVFKEKFPHVSFGTNKKPSGKFDPGSYERGTAAGRRADLGQKRVAQRKALS